MKKLLLLAAIVAVAAYVARRPAEVPPQDADPATGFAPAAAAGTVAEAFAGQRSGVEVEGEGIVERILGDDETGDRHQRFILRLPSGQTLLIAHNIDIAPRIEGLGVGDTVAFRGEYEWNEKGGVVHWTHHDPEGRHEAGWLRRGGRSHE
jgi:uncharacterized protein DUF3465